MKRLGICFTALFLSFTIGHAAEVRLDADKGSYSVSFPTLSQPFTGNVPGTLENIQRSRGQDALGDFEEQAFSAQGLRYSIRVYENNTGLALFTVTTPKIYKGALSFPAFSRVPSLPYHISYDGNFGVYSFKKMGADAPWIFFNEQGSTYVLSPASHYLMARTQGEKGLPLATGMDSSIKTFPTDFSYRAVLVAGQGINKTLQSWGQSLMQLEGRQAPASNADVFLEKLGYWTDRGGTYYYQYEKGLGYEGTLLKVRDEFVSKGITPGYFQIDSWWYPKGTPDGWSKWHILDGIYKFEAAEELFPKGLKSFQNRLGLPLMAHSRWLSSTSPYRRTHKISGNVSIDPKLWDEWMQYAADNGIVGYEQDWLSKDAHANWNLTDPNLFHDLMAASAAKHGLTLQYCMPLPRHYLQGVKYSHLTTIRTSNDRFERSKWKEFLFDSRLATALGIWPWTDVFMSSETSNLLISTLSAGAVGVGDPLGNLNQGNLSKVAMSDGTIVKPDESLLPLDSSYVSEAESLTRLLVSSAYSRRGDIGAAYVFAYNPNNGSVLNQSITAQELGFSGPVYVYDYSQGVGQYVSSGASWDLSAGADGSYAVVVPVLSSGIAFIGDVDKFATLGKQRITSIETSEKSVKIQLKFASQAESAKLAFYAPQTLKFKVTQGSAENVSSAIQYLRVKPDAALGAEIEVRLE